MRKIFIVVFLLLSVILSSCRPISNPVADTSSQPSSGKSVPVTENKVVVDKEALEIEPRGIGIAYNAESVSVNYQSLVPLPLGHASKSPSEGNMFLVVGVAITNNTVQEIKTEDVVEIYIVDGDGTRFDVKPDASPVVSDKIPKGVLKAGETADTQIGFEVPANRTDYRLVYSIDGGEKVVYDLSDGITPPEIPG